MTIEIHNILHDKAKTRKDGVYSYKGYIWVAENKSFKAFADSSGNVFSVFGVFNTPSGKVSPNQRKEKLKEYFLK